MYGVSIRLPPMLLPVFLQQLISHTMPDFISHLYNASGIDVASAVLCTFVVAHLIFLCSRWNSVPLPPGPTAMPLIGNLLDMPNGLEGPHWAKHKNLYGASGSFSSSDFYHLINPP